MAFGTTAPPAPASLKRIVAASLIGTTIEWYDLSSFPITRNGVEWVQDGPPQPRLESR
ncbi:hypothetical protein P1P75_31310 [Streptomyces sp. ID05-39B]|uniref:hypothetical protein n=1 Tax=Streptomyces sp. ID05-39B TaxID=3028664 RepID=UPI0029BC63AD|nr:hypothetical protein [Streptomyces sp. ID05-39B]MDX3530773.1 hypothetical protein [Streptomyces sp. ID05-39B]